MKKLSAYLVTVIGVVVIVFGALFMWGASSSQKTLADEIAPLTISQVDATYEQVSAGAKANPSDVSMALKKASLGLAKSNIGTIDFVRQSGIMAIALGFGVVLVGMTMVMKKE